MYVVVIAVVGTLFACGSNDAMKKQMVHIPQEPDYNQKVMWYTVLNDIDGEGADVFYVPSTWEFDWTTTDGSCCHYADVWNLQHRENMAIEMGGVAE